MGVGDARDLVGGLDARRDRRPALGGVEQRQRVGAIAEHRHAERLEQLRRGGHVEERLHPRRDDDRRGSGRRRRGRRRRPAALGSRGERRRARRCPGSGSRAAAATVSVPPTVVAPTAPCTAQAARSRGPSLRASGVNRSSSSAVEADRESSRRGRRSWPARHPQRAPPPRSPARPPLPAGRGTRARRASSRARRRGASSSSAVRNLVGDGEEIEHHVTLDQGHRAGSLHAARRRFEREGGAADEPSRRQRVAGAGRVDDRARPPSRPTRRPRTSSPRRRA